MEIIHKERWDITINCLAITFSNDSTNNIFTYSHSNNIRSWGWFRQYVECALNIAAISYYINPVDRDGNSNPIVRSMWENALLRFVFSVIHCTVLRCHVHNKQKSNIFVMYYCTYLARSTSDYPTHPQSLIFVGIITCVLCLANKTM